MGDRRDPDTTNACGEPQSWYTRLHALRSLGRRSLAFEAFAIGRRRTASRTPLTRVPSAPAPSLPPLRGSPERIFVSVDQSTGRSTVSFAPPTVGDPIPLDGDPTGTEAVASAKAIVAAYPGCTIVGPHFHSSALGRARPRRRR